MEKKGNKLAWASSDQAVQCLPTEPVVTMVISLQTASKGIPPRRRVRLIRDLCSFVARPALANPRTVTMETSTKEGNVAFMSGHGDVVGNRPGVHLSWPVACGGDASQLPGLDEVESSAASGELARALGFGVVEWRVENRKPAAVRIVPLSQLRKGRLVNYCIVFCSKSPGLGLCVVLLTTTISISLYSVK